MPAILVPKSVLVPRKNFASKNPGIILVFCILGALGILIIGLVTQKWLQRRRARAPVEVK